MTLARRPVALVIAVSLVTFFAAWTQVSVPAAASIDDAPGIQGFMRAEGISGEATRVGYEGWSVITDVQTSNLSSLFGQSLGQATGGGAGKTLFEEIIVAKPLDSAGPALQNAVHKSQTLPSVEIHLVRDSEQGGVAIYQIQLRNAHVSSYSLGTTAQTDLTPQGLPLVGATGVPIEQITLHFEAVTVTYTEQKADGSTGESTTYTYDLKSNK